MKYDVIIIGAGAAGLMAAKLLLKKGLTVCLLEADSCAGGRMKTLHTDGFEQPVESGAEFVHGKLPLTLKLLKKAGIKYDRIKGEMITVTDEKKEPASHGEHWNEFSKELKKLQDNISLSEFLHRHFSAPEYAELRAAVCRFSEGFDLADPDLASALAAKEEWGHEEETQYRVRGGYMQLTEYLLRKTDRKNRVIFFNARVKRVEQNDNKVKAILTDGKIFEAKHMILTVSLGILKSNAIEIDPLLPAYKKAIDESGFGTVIKIIIQFKKGFWRELYPDAGFILSNEKIPTWWTQNIETNNILTGWVGGGMALKLTCLSDDEIFSVALHSLANIFKLKDDDVMALVAAHKVFNWKKNELAYGGYSFNTVDSSKAKQVFSKPMGRIFFAGEGYHTGESQGTVEAALQNGKAVAKQLFSKKKTQSAE